MNVRRVTMRRFMRHDELDVELPERGVVLVTGKNGSGKSSIVEAVAMACFGKTLRGTSPWSGDEGMAELVLAGSYTVRRVRRGAKTQLRFGVAHDKAEDYENMTKAQAALEQVIGDFDLWRRTHVFSSQDAAHFTLATDGERKRLLESLLGLDRFDVALEACRKDLRLAEREVAETERAVAVAQGELEGWKRQFKDAVDELSVLPQEGGDSDALASEADECARLVKDINVELEQINRDDRDMHRALDRAGIERDALEEKAHALSEDACAECGQPIAPELRNSAQEKLEAACHRFDDVSTASLVKVKSLSAQKEALLKERDELARQSVAAKIAAAEARVAAGARAQAEGRQAKAKAGKGKAATALKEAQRAQLDAFVIQAELEACTQVLGLRGVRAHVLGRALSGIEAMANSWLARLDIEGLTVSLRPYVEKKTGGVSDAISFEVVGAGGGNGYRGSSGGERRRIDVAMLFALAEVAAAARGGEQGTLFVDEAFDSLDDDGVASVAEALEELAKERCVAVITHNDALAGSLHAVKEICL